MKLINKTDEKVKFTAKISVSLANAIRRSVWEVPVLAISEVDFYKNDSALYDEILAHRLGLVPLKNQKLKQGEFVELKLKTKGKGEVFEVLSGELGEDVVYPNMPLVLLREGQELELVARARVGIGLEHARFIPGMIVYKHMPHIKISKEGEKHKELAELYPEVFEFDGSLKVRDESAYNYDSEELESYKGVDVSFDDELVFEVESWGQMKASDIFIEACKALKSNLSKISKELK